MARNQEPPMNRPPLELTQDTYHSLDADRAFMSSHQFGAWVECSAAEKCRQSGEYTGELAEIFNEEREALVMGSYLDTALLQPDRLDKLVMSAPEWWFKKERKTKQNPTPGYDYKEPTARLEKVLQMVARAKRDGLFMAALKGTPQLIITWQMFGVWWKMAADVVDKDADPLTATDLKTAASLNQTAYDKDLRIHVPFYETFNYWRQFGIYREGIKAEFGKLPAFFYMPVVTKEKYPDIDVFLFDDQDRFEREIREVEEKMPQIIRWKSGEDKPIRCEQCNYCHVTKVLENVQRARNFKTRSPM